ncbi:hypothetical protein HPB50_023742 [Hyalomma asiaticum]|uniref:Uncharacterized protein n=1 Tax=Hyalomma asiaticum TaxID=266040 RepID=A0ACB7SI34_HYAAI|nr:hypothetical protein HPB50_023742 [Hyalomma asiaticum]
MANAMGIELDDDIIVDEEALNAFVNFPPEVQAAIEQVFPSTDPLDSPNFNPVDYINTLFPTEQSLANVDEVIARMKTKIRRLDEQIRTVVRGQGNLGSDGRASLEEAQRSIHQLFLCIRDIKEKAEKSEHMVKEITRDIKQLDNAKRHLTASITTLNHLHMLVEGVDGLKYVSTFTASYFAWLLVARLVSLVQLLRCLRLICLYFPYFRVATIQSDLAQQITADFHDAFTGPNAKHSAPTQQLAEACLVVSILDKKVKQELLKWFVSLQLAEYTHLFQANQDVAWLDRVDRRYAWLKNHLVKFESKFGQLFPADWEVSERIAVEFCHITRQVRELSQLMSSRVQDMEVRLLLSAIQKTTAFEALLGRRFTGVTLERTNMVAPTPAPILPPAHPSQQSPKSTNPFEEGGEENNPFAEDMEKDEKVAPSAAAGAGEPLPSESTPQQLSPPQMSLANVNPFQGLVSGCFERHLDIYVESQDRTLKQLLDQFVEAAQRAPLPQPDVETAGVLPSCADLFVYYKKCLVQCSQLSRGQPLLALARVFGKHLADYAGRVLQGSLPKTGSSSSSGMTAAGLIQNFQSLLKEGESPRLTPPELCRICGVLSTAEYCLETTQQLEGKLKEKIEPSLASKIDLTAEQDMFNGVINNCIQLLVHDLEAACEPALSTITKTNWSLVKAVGDQSSYVTAITSHLRQTLPLIRDNLANSRRYFTQFCVHFVSSFIPRLISQLFKCKPMSPIGAEQLLLDTHSLKMVLLDLPLLESQVARKAPASYTKIVVKGMTKAEMLLKMVLAPHEPAESFVEHYTKQLPESDAQEFQKVLDMKGLKRSEQNVLTEVFRTRIPTATSSSAAPSEGGTAAQLLSALAIVTTTTPEHESSRIRRFEKLIKKRL